MPLFTFKCPRCPNVTFHTDVPHVPRLCPKCKIKMYDFIDHSPRVIKDNPTDAKEKDALKSEKITYSNLKKAISPKNKKKKEAAPSKSKRTSTATKIIKKIDGDNITFES